MPDTPAQRYGIMLDRLLSSGPWQRALRTAEEWLAADPECLRAHRIAGWSSVNLQCYPQALRHLEKVLAGNPRDAFAHRLACIACHRQGFSDRAVGYIKEALRLRPEDPANWHQAAWMCYCSRSYLLAAKHARRALELAPDDANVINLLALCERADPQQQLACYHRALELDPENPSVHHNLGVYYLDKKGDCRRAAEEFRVALSHCPTNRETQEKLGFAQHKFVVEQSERDRLYRFLSRPGHFLSNDVVMVILLPTIFGLFMSGAEGTSRIRPFAFWLMFGLPIFVWLLFCGYRALLIRDILQRERLTDTRRSGPLGFWHWAHWQRLAVFFGANFVGWTAVLWFCAVIPGVTALAPFFLLLALLTGLHTARAAWAARQPSPCLPSEPVSGEVSLP